MQRYDVHTATHSPKLAGDPEETLRLALHKLNGWRERYSAELVFDSEEAARSACDHLARADFDARLNLFPKAYRVDVRFPCRFASRFARLALETGGKLEERHSYVAQSPHRDATNLDGSYDRPDGLNARLADAEKVSKELDGISLDMEYRITPEGGHVLQVGDSELALDHLSPEERKTFADLERMAGLVQRLTYIIK
jgi:hypothetical protein